MKLILTESVQNLGNIGEIVDVSNGYGRNYLMLSKKAIPATPGNLKMLQGKLKRQLTLEARTKEQAAELAGILEEVSLTAVVQVGEDDRMFGSVTQQHVADLLKEKGYEIDRAQDPYRGAHQGAGHIHHSHRAAHPGRGRREALGGQGIGV